MPVLTASIAVASTMLAVAAGMTFIRLVKGPTLPDRVIAIDLIGVLMVCMLVVTASATQQQALLDVAMVVALISFVGTVAYARLHRAEPICDRMAVQRVVHRRRLLALLASVGVLRMPDVLTRMQASTKASTLGLGCLLLGLAIRNPELAVVMRAGSIAAFMLLTTAVGAHVIARASARGGPRCGRGPSSTSVPPARRRTSRQPEPPAAPRRCRQSRAGVRATPPAGARQPARSTSASSTAAARAR